MKKINARTLANIIILFIIGFSCFTWGLLIGQTTVPYKQNYTLLNAYEQYYKNTEILLDSIYSTGLMSEDNFTNIVMETNTYHEYEVARDKIDSLTNKN